jgi:hypothetical protein
MARKQRAFRYDDPVHGRTPSDTNPRAPSDPEGTHVDTVSPTARLAEDSSHPFETARARELPLYPGISQPSSRCDDLTVPDAALQVGAPAKSQPVEQARTTEHSSAPSSGTRHVAPELPPVPEPPTKARSRELERMVRLVTPLPTDEWSIAPSIHEWREEWGARRDSAEFAAARRRSRVRLRTLVLVVTTLLAAAVIGTALGDARKLTRLVDRATEFIRGTEPKPAALPQPVTQRSPAPTSLARPPARQPVPVPHEPSGSADAPEVPTVRVGELPLLAEPVPVEDKPRRAKPKRRR